MKTSIGFAGHPYMQYLAVQGPHGNGEIQPSPGHLAPGTHGDDHAVGRHLAPWMDHPHHAVTLGLQPRRLPEEDLAAHPLHRLSQRQAQAIAINLAVTVRHATQDVRTDARLQPPYIVSTDPPGVEVAALPLDSLSKDTLALPPASPRLPQASRGTWGPRHCPRSDPGRSRGRTAFPPAPDRSGRRA